jgi:hypothetical protein
MEIMRPASGAVDLYRNGIRPGVLATLRHLGLCADFHAASESREAVAAAGPQDLRGRSEPLTLR